MARKTYIDYKDYATRAVLNDAETAHADEFAGELVCDAVREIWMARRWNFHRTQYRVVLQPTITSGVISGTASATSGSATVTFNAQLGVPTGALSGQLFQLPGDDERLYIIQTNTSGSITLADNNQYVGATSGGADFRIFRVSYAVSGELVDAIGSPITDRAFPLQNLNPDTMLWAMKAYGSSLGGGNGTVYYTFSPNPITEEWSFNIFPAPVAGDSVKAVDFTFYRIPRLPVDDTDIIDLPEEFDTTIRAAIDYLGVRYLNFGQNPELRLAAEKQRFQRLQILINRLAQKDLKIVNLGAVGASRSAVSNFGPNLPTVQITTV